MTPLDKKRPRIVFIAANEWAPWGGSEYLWSGAAEKLARRGVDVSVSVKDWGAAVKQIELLRSIGCRIIYRRWPPPLSARVARRLGVFNDHVLEHVRKLGRGGRQR